ncbi:hypothetical protein Undi14_04685 [Undibacterium sp. 14-3-2]|uniref:GapS4a family protein n=1 Tax=Undibacterium sp. 14-3-2 TaxID=2800129 RepID=UPI0019083A26|nr:hypothetical protein [Undibacterium sp. 14-3-2]MBK1889319.1 hypothetical protein [Undibacterium sp. 14-3-2]
MSGEDSKRSGEIGETLAKAFLDLIGWGQSLQSVSINCNDLNHKTASDNQKRSHGDDLVFIYNNPFYDSRTDVVHISVKNNLNGYAEKESDLKSNFKNHLEEVNEIISCAQYDSSLLNLLSKYKSRKHKEHSGLLIWTSSEKKTADKDILSIIKNVKLQEEKCNKSVYLVDGARYKFILTAITHIKAESGIKHFDFFYPETGGLVNRLDERHGDILPLELIVSDIIPVKAQALDKEILYLYVNQAFEQDCYRRVLSLALGFAGAWPHEIRIGFPDYNAAHHANDVIASELPFVDRKKKFVPFCFNLSNLNALG